MEEEKKETQILRERVRTLKHIALEISREADEQAKLMDTNQQSFSEMLGRINSTVDNLRKLIEKKFSIKIFLVFSTVGFLVILFVLFKIL